MADSQPGASRQSGLLSAVRRLADTAAGVVQTRLELLSVELEEERARIGQLLVLVAAAGFFLALGVTILSFFVILLAGESHRLLVTGLLAAAFIGVGVVFVLKARAAARERSRLFSASLAELRKDRDELA